MSTFNSGVPVSSCTKSTCIETLHVFNIWMACRGGVFVLFHLRFSTSQLLPLVIFVIQEVPITKLYAQEPPQTPTLTFGMKFSTDMPEIQLLTTQSKVTQV